MRHLCILNNDYIACFRLVTFRPADSIAIEALNRECTTIATKGWRLFAWNLAYLMLPPLK